MIGFVVVCVGFLVVLALVVQIVDSMGAPALRTLAAERRERWERRAVATRAVLGRRTPRRAGLMPTARPRPRYCDGCGTVQLIFGLTPT